MTETIRQPKDGSFIMAAEELVRTGKAAIALPLRDQVRSVIPLFLNFLAEPKSYKQQWTVDLNNGDPDDGYIRRDGGNYDHKDFFHYRPRLPAELSARGVDLRNHRQFLSQCSHLYHECSIISYCFAKALDSVLPGFGFEEKVNNTQAQQLNVMRFLYYDTLRDNEKTIAKSHADRCFLTIHVDESHPGLRLGNSEELYVAKPDHSLIFPGQKAEVLTKGRLTALRHKVTDEHVGQPGTSPNRWSIVFFNHIDQPAS